MGIRFYCPNGCKLNVKSFLAGKRGVCPECGVGVDIPLEDTRPPSKRKNTGQSATVGAASQRNGQGNDGAVVTKTLIPNNSPVVAGKENPSVATMEDPPRATPSTETPAAASLPAGSTPASPISAAPTAASAPSAPPRQTAPNPIDEAPDAVWYVRPPSGGQFGPAEGEIMRRWIGERRVSGDSLIWREGWEEWQTAGPLFPELEDDLPDSSPEPIVVAPVLVENPGYQSVKARRARPNNHLGLVVLVGLGLLSLILLVAFIVIRVNSTPGGDQPRGSSATHRATVDFQLAACQYKTRAEDYPRINSQS